MKASLLKMIQSNSGSKQGKSVVVLLSTDVRESNGEVYLPTLSEQTALRNEKKGQFNNNVLFTWNMTDEDVKKEIISHFTYLKDQSFCCASAVDGRTRLKFHGKRKVWDGGLIKRNIKGNSALYILTEMTADDLSRVLQEPTGEQSSHSAGAVSCVVKEHSTSSQIPTSSQTPNQKSVTITRKNDHGVQKGLPMVPPVVSPPVKRKKGNHGYAINQAIPQNQSTKVTTEAPAVVKFLCFPATQTSMQKTVIPGQIAFPALTHLQQKQPPEGPVQGHHQIVVPQCIPSPATAGSSQQVLAPRAGRDPLKMPSVELSVPWQKNQPPEGLVQGQHQIVVPQGIPSPATAGSSQEVLVQRAEGDPLKMPSTELSVPWQIDSGCESSKEDRATNGMCEFEESSLDPFAFMTPDYAYTKEEKKFTVSFSEPLPCDVTLCRADFEGLGVANLTQKNPYTLVGVNPISQIPREVTVKIIKFTENVGWMSFGEDLKFTYKDKRSEVLEEFPESEEVKNALWESFLKILQSTSAGSDDSNPFRRPEAGISTTTENDDSKSVKLLTLLIYKAAKNNSFEFVDLIFSTSVGKVVFSHYKNNPTQPEDVARANGHKTLGNYFENANRRLSKERIEDKSETVNWLELKHALEKKQDQPCNDDVQTPIYPEIDKSQRDYDADDEVSNSSSPFSEITDPGCEDKEHDTTVSLTPTDDNDAHPSNQAKAEKQRDQYEVEGQKVESLFTDDDAVTNVALHPNQEGADPADDHFLSSAVMSVAGETSNAIELSSEGGTKSSAERQNQEPTDSMTISLPCEINTGTLMNRYIQTTTKNTFWKRYCSETDQKEGQDELEKPLGYNQGEAGPANDHIVTSTVTNSAGETPNSFERGSEVGKNSGVSRHIQGLLAGITKVPPCLDNAERVAGPFIIMKTENNRKERSCGRKEREEELNNLDKPPVKQGTLTYEELQELANHVDSKWKNLGRLFGVKEPKLHDVEQRHWQLCARAYQMIMDWKEENGCAATYQVYATLQHKLVQHKEVAEQVCYNHDSELNLSQKEMAFASEGITNLAPLFNQEGAVSDGDSLVSYDVVPGAAEIVKSSESYFGGAKNSRASHLDQRPFVAAASVPLYGNKPQRLVGPFTQTSTSPRSETDRKEAVDCYEWLLSRGITWPFIKSKEQQDQSAKTVQGRNWSVFTNEVDLGVSSLRTFDVSTCRRKLAEHYRRTTAAQTSVWGGTTVYLDQVYCRLSWVKEERTPAGSLQSELFHYTDLLNEDKNGFRSKRILVQGPPGIGKSTFVTKMALDWCAVVDESVIEKHKGALSKFELAFIINLREVATFRNLRDVIKGSRIFSAEDRPLTEQLLSYIATNQEKVLCVFDGYDEYHPRHDSEIFQIFKGNKLKDCSVMITTRTSERDELVAHADTCAEITGFNAEYRTVFITRILGCKTDAQALMGYIAQEDLEDLARVPLLLLFLCTLWKKANFKSLPESKTKLHYAIVQGAIGREEWKPSHGICRNVEDFEQSLVDMGKVVLKCLLRGDILLDYDQLPTAIILPESSSGGLLQGFHNTESSQPRRTGVFIHKSVQEFLAAFYIVYRCVPEGHLGEVQQHICNLHDCEALRNVLQFVCGLSDNGAVKVFELLRSVRNSHPELDFRKAVPKEKHRTVMRLCDLSNQQYRFIDLVYNCFEEVQSKNELLKLCVDCAGGIFLVDNRFINLLRKMNVNVKELTQLRESVFFVVIVDALNISMVHDLVELLGVLDVPLRITENSTPLPLGDFLKKFVSTSGCQKWGFSAIIYFRLGKTQVHITESESCCDNHCKLFAGDSACFKEKPSKHSWFTGLSSFVNFHLPKIRTVAYDMKWRKRLLRIEHYGSPGSD